MQIQPYLFFDGRCQEAIDFYSKAVGAQVNMLMHFKDSPDKDHIPPGGESKVMHADIRIGQSNILLSDGGCFSGHPKFEGSALSLTVANEAEADRVFNALVEGGQVTMPLIKTFFSPRFGMLADRFGVQWMVYVAPQS